MKQTLLDNLTLLDAVTHVIGLVSFDTRSKSSSPLNGFGAIAVVRWNTGNNGVVDGFAPFCGSGRGLGPGAGGARRDAALLNLHHVRSKVRNRAQLACEAEAPLEQAESTVTIEEGYGMAKRVFFSFHYQDVINFRANVVRQHWLTKADREESGFFDASIWEKSRLEGEASLKRLINGGLEGTSNTCVLIGSETFARPWVRYELLKSFVRGNHLFGVHINGLKAKDGPPRPLGHNPLAYLGVIYAADGKSGTLHEWNAPTKAWTKYNKIGGTPSFKPAASVPVGRWGKSFILSKLYPTYDWCTEDGYNNFSAWVR